MTDETQKPTDFIHEAVAEDLRSGRFTYVRTRLPPEPNGYLHIGHVKAFLIDYNIAKDFGGELDLRFDDTNPAKEETEFVDAIQEDAHWLGIEWKQVLFSSDFFDTLYEWAIKLVKKGKAYVDDQSPEEVSKNRGTLDRARRRKPLPQPLGGGEPGPAGAHEERRIPGWLARPARQDRHGARQHEHARPDHVPHHPRAAHHRTGKKWCIYPMYDWAQGQNDAMHGVTHSLCSIEYEDHRPLYEWFLNELEIENKPRQIEFARLNLNYTVMSKRKLRRLVEEKYVERLGRPAHAHPARHAPARRIPPRPSAISSPAPAWPRTSTPARA